MAYNVRMGHRLSLLILFILTHFVISQSADRELPERSKECGWLQGNPFGPVTEAIPHCSEPTTTQDQQSFTTDNPRLTWLSYVLQDSRACFYT
jgi:hypothetical protein